MTEWRYCTRCGAALEPSLVSPDLKDSCPACGWFRATYAMPVALVLAHTDDARVVLTRKRDWPEAAWALVAGFIELGESAEDAALRELREETGLEGRNPRIRRTLVRDDLLLVCVEVDIDEARPEALSDIDEAILVTDAADRIPREWSARIFVEEYLRSRESPAGITRG